MAGRLQYSIKVLMLALVMVAVVMLLPGWFLYQTYLDEPLAFDADSMIFHIPPCSNLALAASELGELGYLRYPKLLVLHARLNDLTLIQAGEYQLKKGLTPRSLLKKFNTGEVLTFSTTLPEGLAFKEIRAILEANTNLIADIKNLKEAEIIKQLGLDIEHLEGWFYPDTYIYTRNTKVSSIIAQAYRQMRDLLEQTWATRDTGLPIETSYEALILASIVEKETGVAYERPEIAGVFIRRLQKRMKLQTDPTVIYAMGDRYQGNIKHSDLSIDSPYNTYKYKGLPPTPIASPGLAALEAVIHPAEGNALYFVAKGDGSHYFSSSLDEHTQAVRKFQIEQRTSNYRSSPASNQPNDRNQKSK